MRKIALLIFGLTCWNLSYSQFNYGIESFAGMGTMYNNFTPHRDVEHYINNYRFNWMGGLFGRYDISKKSSIELDLLYNRINSYWGWHIDIINNGVYVGTNYDNVERKFDYLSFPFTYQHTLKRFRINIGPQYSVLMNNFGIRLNYGLNGWDTTMTVKFIDLIKSDLSLTVFLSYSIFNKFSIEGRFNQDIINTADTKSGYVFKCHSRQYLIGLKYSIRNDQKK